MDDFNSQAVPPPPPIAGSMAPYVPPGTPGTAPPVMPPPVSPPWSTMHKSPVLAGFLSMFPGLGHLYLGLYPRGIAFGIAFVISISASAHGRGEFFGPMIAFIWFFAIIDAVRQAHAINRGYVAESGFASASAPVRRPAAGAASLFWGVVLMGLGALWLIDRYVDIDWSFLDRWGAPVAFILLGLALVITHVRRKRRENEEGVGMPPRTL